VLAGATPTRVGGSADRLRAGLDVDRGAAVLAREPIGNALSRTAPSDRPASRLRRYPLLAEWSTSQASDTPDAESSSLARCPSFTPGAAVRHSIASHRHGIGAVQSDRNLDRSAGPRRAGMPVAPERLTGS
jgi:hypothetical protein